MVPPPTADDGGRSARNVVEGAFFALVVVLGMIHVYLAVFLPDISAGRSEQFLLIAAAFFAGGLVRLTPFWRPILYLLGAGFGFYLNVLWLLGENQNVTFAIATLLATTVFAILALYLFVQTESRATKR